MTLVREIPLLEDVPLSPSRIKHLKTKREYGTTVRIRLLNIVPTLLIEYYQRKTVNRPHVCNMYPSCSEYARIAYLRYGLITASGLVFERLFECADFDTTWPQRNKP